jgi:hypothetical protein
MHKSGEQVGYEVRELPERERSELKLTYMHMPQS